MKRTWWLVLAAAGASALILTTVGLAGSRAAGATEIAALLDAKQEVPKPKAKAGAAGLFTGTIRGGTLSWRIVFTNLTGPASGGGHIHSGKPGRAGPVVVPLCGPCKAGQRGTTAIPAAVVRAIRTGGAYVNVHTSANAAGEIRGVLVVVG